MGRAAPGGAATGSSNTTERNACPVPDRRRISKLLSLILRHHPDEFGLNMDEYGYMPLDEVVEAVQQRYSAVEEEDIRDLIETSRQRRFEIVGDRIRALYGHTFFVEMDGEPMDPPESLFLCVSAAQVRRMKEEGLHSEDRSYLHLSPTREIAESRSGAVDDPCIVEVYAEAAATEAEVEFWDRGEVVLTRQTIAPEFVGEVVEIQAPPAADGERESRGGGRRGRRGRDSRGRGERGGGAQGQGQRPSEQAPADGAPQESAPSPRREAPVLPLPVRGNGEAASRQEITYGRRPKFNQGSGRR